MGGSLSAFEDEDEHSETESVHSVDSDLPAPMAAPSSSDLALGGRKKYRRASFAHTVEVDLPAWNEDHREAWDPHSQSFHNLSDAFLQVSASPKSTSEWKLTWVPGINS